MDVKDLRTQSGLSERNNEGSKYSQAGVTLQRDRNKSYQDIGSIPLGKAEPTPVRPCAVIGPDRVVPPPASNDAFLKKGPVEPWPSPDNLYHRPPEYPHKISSNQNPSRNISPRQTFQENMQRILVPPTYNAVRHSDESNFNHVLERNVAISKNVKPNMASEAKYSDVPYAMNALTHEPKSVRDTEMYASNVNSPLTRNAPHGWPASSVNVYAPRTYGAHELYQYPQYPSCTGQRPLIPMARPHRTIQEDPAYVYPDNYFQDASARFKSFPHVKERYPQSRYEYITNYSSHQFHPPAPLQHHKHDISKSGQSLPYSVYPHLKYLDNRGPDHTMDGYQRTPNQPPHYNIPYRNQVIHPTYTQVSGNSSQNKPHPYPPDGSVKTAAPNKLPNDNSSKMYIEYENARIKYPVSDNYFVNEMTRVHPNKNQTVLPNYSSIGVHSIPTQQYYRKDNPQMKPFEYMPHFRNYEHPLNSNPMLRHAPQFSPNTLAISPTDSNTSNDNLQTHATSQEDCGYVSQSSTASVRSIDSGMYRIPNEYYKRYDFRYGPIGSSPAVTRTDSNTASVSSKETKQKIDVRQFLQMWNEGEDENSESNAAKEVIIQTGSSETSNYPKHHVSNQDQLYVLGLVNVPSEELCKYEHIQKISKLPENIKGYNNLELLSQFEEAIESSKTSSYKSNVKDYHNNMSSKDNSPKQVNEALPRPVSPLDVEAKISQSVIHKEVGCNFEIRPCSPKMLSVEVAAPIQNILGERVIEKVTNPLSKTVKSSIKSDDSSNCHTIQRQDNAFAIKDNPSCKMVRSPYATNNIESAKTNYSLQDLEINSGLCLASLPRLDNEIELNFPEVNQQFINANKKDSNSMQNNCPRINMEEERGLSGNKFDKTNMDKTCEKALMADAPEKTFTKLSKYRKSKIPATDHLENNQLTKAVRTDSVIIKNPENVKNIEDKLLEDSHNIPMNLSAQSSEYHAICNFDLPDKFNENKYNDVDIALDFSINKSGHGLPIIEIENSDSTKVTDMSGNASLMESFKMATTINKNLLNKSEEIIPKCDESEPNLTTCLENNQNEIENGKDYFNKDTTSSVVNNISTHLNDACIVEENPPTANKHLNVDFGADHVNTHSCKEISEILKTCKDNDYVSSKKQPWLEKYDTGINTDTSREKVCSKQNVAEDFVNGSDLIPTELVSNCEGSREMMELLSSENDGSNVMHDNEINLRYKTEFIMSSQNKNDFENDEISAKLEKLFQESDEDISMENEVKTLSKSHKNDSNVSVTMPVETVYYHQSKELYSPRIQKLLIHTEGLCSHRKNGSIQEETIKSISDDTFLRNLASTNTGTKEEKYQENQIIDQDDKPTCSIEHTSEILIENTMQFNSVFDAKFESKPESNIKSYQTDTVDYNCPSSAENKSFSTVKTLISDDTNISNKTKLWSENDKINRNVKTRKSHARQCELNSFQNLELVEKQLNCETVELCGVTSINNKPVIVCEIENKESHETKNCGKSDDESKTQDDQSTLSHHSSSNTEYQTDKNQQEDSLSQNVFKNNNIATNLETSDNNGIRLELGTVVLGSNNTHISSLSKTVSADHAHQTCNNSELLIENVVTNNNTSDFTEKTDQSKFVSEFDNNVEENLQLHLKNVSNNVSGDYSGAEEKQSTECLTENAAKLSDIVTDEPSAQEVSNNCSVESSHSTSSDSCTPHQKIVNSTRESLIEKPIAIRDSDIRSDNIVGALVNITSEDSNSFTTSNSVFDNCTGLQTKENQIGKISVDQTENKNYSDTVTIQHTSVRSNISRDFDCKVQDDKDNLKIKNSHDISNQCTLKGVENQFEGNLIKNNDSKRGDAFDCDNINRECDDKAQKEFDESNIGSYSAKDEALQTLDCVNVVRNFEGHVQEVFNNSGTEKLSGIVSENCSPQQQIAETKHSDGNRGKQLHPFDIGDIDRGCDDEVKKENIIPGIANCNVTDETQKTWDCGKIGCDLEGQVQKVFNNPGIESVSKMTSDDYVNPTKENHSDGSSTEKCDNVIGNFNGHENPSSILSDIVSDDYFEHQAEENCSERTSIVTVNSVADAALDGVKIDNERNDNVQQNSNNTGEENQNDGSLIYYKTRNCESVAGETSETLDSTSIVCEFDGAVQENLNNPNVENMFSNIADKCTTNRTEETEIAANSLDGSKVNDKLQNDLKNLSVENQSNIVSDDCTALKPENNRSFGREHLNENINSDVVDTFNNNICKFDKLTQAYLNNTGLKSVSEVKTGTNIDTSVILKVSEENIINSDSLVQKKINNIFTSGNVSKCESDGWGKHQKESDWNKNDRDVLKPKRCDNNVDCYQGDENDEVQLKHHKSNLSNIEILIEKSPVKRKFSLKRSFSDSALHNYKNKDASDTHMIENTPLIWPAKRQRLYEFENSEEHLINENLCSIIQNNRRNSVSSFYNEGNLSFCILIDNDCIITEENEEEKICFAEIAEDCSTEINTMNEEEEEDSVGEIICCSQQNQIVFSESVILDYENEKSVQESWLDDVACVETVISDDIEENIVLSTHDSPLDVEIETSTFNCEHTDGVNFTYNNELNQDIEVCNGINDPECKDTILPEYNNSREVSSLQTPYQDPILQLPDDTNSKMPKNKENISVETVTLESYNNENNVRNDENIFSADITRTDTSSCNITHEDARHSCESSIDTEFNYKEPDKEVSFRTSSSPEVSSTTSEEKGSSILLKITNYNGSRVSEVNEVSHNKPRCKFTEKKDYSNSHGSFPKRPLLTKAAQKYIPPIKESIRDLTVKLTLPQQRLLKLKQLKLARNEPKANKQSNVKLSNSKKSKPNFEDVLKSIDEVQIKMHKEKTKKSKNSIPKVVIKKTLYGSHYTSSNNKDIFNPDLTGRKWQPWVFLEKNHFIDKMAIRNKTKAVYNHRKNAYVLAETFKKYKAVCNSSAKFIISQPKTSDSSKGQLKYTIKLKHSY